MISEQFERVRARTNDICAPLQIEDFSLQCMADASPPKWHLAHTSWFFEHFILMPFKKGYKEFNANFPQLFNSYYETVGTPFPRQKRGLVSRPSLPEVQAYRTYVDHEMLGLLSSLSPENEREIIKRLDIGINHEMQHQELLYTDIKFNLFSQLGHPSYRQVNIPTQKHDDKKAEWSQVGSGLYEVGKNASDGFSYDNESPRHKVYQGEAEISSRLVTNSEYREFIDAGGYGQVEFWLAEGWNYIKQNNIFQPLYWLKKDSTWQEYTLNGIINLAPHSPVAHLSYFEANAFAAWQKARLPSEFELEILAQKSTLSGNFMNSQDLHPQAASLAEGLEKNTPLQVYGDLWEWTSSAYAPYPKFKSLLGALGEYNAKFMCNQYTLRGGSCVTPRESMRASYRNFFPADARWQFSGIRLARDL